MTGKAGEGPAAGTGKTEGACTIVAKEVEVRFGEIVALDHFSVDVPKGLVGLLGPNGAGKSTFIKTVLGLVQPESGYIRVAGLDPATAMMAIRDKVGYMPEHDCLVDTMTGVELVTYMGRLSGMSKGDATPRSHEMLDFVGVGEERYRPIGSYSTGMKQRVKLAQAIVHDPEVLFLDEPTNGMDPVGREEMLDLIGRIAASDKSILLSSHILQDVEKVCKEVIIVSGGRRTAQGSLATLLAREDGRRRLQVRGRPENLARFITSIGREHEVVSTSEEFGQVTLVLRGVKGSRDVFALAKEDGVQVRSFLPDRMTLEDYFISTVAEAV
jgi:ABC-2 type transport system ATP-binding protein